MTEIQFHYTSGKGPTLTFCARISLQFKTPTYWDTLNKLKPSEMKGCIRMEFRFVCGVVLRVSELHTLSVCTCDRLCLRFPVSPGICQNGELHQRRAGTQLETRPHVWCALTTGETSERERNKKMRERGEQPSARQTCHPQNWWCSQF